jgi:lysophospholipase L1-like esterase
MAGYNDLIREVPIKTFRENVDLIVKTLKDTGAQVTVVSLLLNGERFDGSNPSDDLMEEYCAVLRIIATKQKVQFLDLRNAVMGYMEEINCENLPQGVLTHDGSHFNLKGNTFVATMLLKSLGFNRPSTLDMSILRKTRDCHTVKHGFHLSEAVLAQDVDVRIPEARDTRNEL